VWRLFNRRFGSFYSPDVPKGAMVNHAKAATWEDEAEADAEAERFNERDRVPEYGPPRQDPVVRPGRIGLPLRLRADHLVDTLAG
jgi:hypothetical protein